MTDTDHYDYSVDKSDNSDQIDFGKFKGSTPVEVLRIKPSWLVWAWENTNKWVGSEHLLMNAYGRCGRVFKERECAIEDETSTRESTEDFDNAVLDAYGVSPLKAKHTWEDNHK